MLNCHKHTHFPQLGKYVPRVKDDSHFRENVAFKFPQKAYVLLHAVGSLLCFKSFEHSLTSARRKRPVFFVGFFFHVLHKLLRPYSTRSFI